MGMGYLVIGLGTWSYILHIVLKRLGRSLNGDELGHSQKPVRDLGCLQFVGSLDAVHPPGIDTVEAFTHSHFI